MDEFILKEMNFLYTTFCHPIIKIKNNKIVEIFYEWKDLKAKELYLKYQELLILTQKENYREWYKWSIK